MLCQTNRGALDHLPELRGFDVVSQLAPAIEADSELILGTLTLLPGQGLALHAHGHSEMVFLLEGAARMQRERGIVELHAPSAAYFPANAYHGISGLGDGGCRMLLCYPRGGGARPVETTFPEPGADLSGRVNPNLIAAQNLLFRWALAEDFEPSVGVEPSKGLRITARYLFDPLRGAPDVVAGTCRQQAHVHYTLHRHRPPEIYYLLEGAGVVHVGSELIRVSAGSAVYVPPSVVHGIDTFEQPVHYFWMYALDRSGPDWTWEAVEDVYDVPR